MQLQTMPTRETTIKLAEQVGIKWQYLLNGKVLLTNRVTLTQLQQFAQLVKELK